MQQIQTIQDANPGKKFKHLGVFGESGSGKSYLTNEMYKAADCAAVYFNYPQKEADDYSIPGRRFSNKTHPAKVKKAIENGEKVKYKPSSNPKKARNQLKAIYAMSKQVDGQVIIYVDEVQRFVSEMLAEIVEDGRGHKVRFVLISQYPDRIKDKGDYGKYVLRTIYDVGLWYIFSASELGKGFFKHYKLPMDDIQEKCQLSEYAFTVLDGNQIIDVAEA